MTSPLTPPSNTETSNGQKTQFLPDKAAKVLTTITAVLFFAVLLSGLICALLWLWVLMPS